MVATISVTRKFVKCLTEKNRIVVRRFWACRLSGWQAVKLDAETKLDEIFYPLLQPKSGVTQLLISRDCLKHAVFDSAHCCL